MTTTLVVEDNPMDARMIRYALREANWDTAIVVADDGEKAVQYLLRQGSYRDAVQPDLVILDLNLPKRSGSEVLAALRAAENLQHVPVVVFSSAPEDVIADILNQSRVNADLLLTKPLDVTDYLALGHVFRRCYEEHTEARRSSGGGQA